MTAGRHSPTIFKFASSTYNEPACEPLSLDDPPTTTNLIHIHMHQSTIISQLRQDLVPPTTHDYNLLGNHKLILRIGRLSFENVRDGGLSSYIAR